MSKQKVFSCPLPCQGWIVVNMEGDLAGTCKTPGEGQWTGQWGQSRESVVRLKQEVAVQFFLDKLVN